MKKYLKVFSNCVIALIIALNGSAGGNEYDASWLRGEYICDYANDTLIYKDHFTLNETTKGVIQYMANASHTTTYTNLAEIFFPNLEILASWSSPV